MVSAGYIALLICLCALWIISLKYSNWEVTAPAPFFLLGMSIAALLDIVGSNTWNNVSLGLPTFAIILAGSVAVFGGVVCGDAFMKRRSSNKDSALISTDSSRVLAVNSRVSWKYFILIGIVFAAIVLRIMETYRLASELGIATENYFSMAKQVRDHYAAFMSSDGLRFDEGFSFLERQLEKAVSAIAYVSVYLLTNSLTTKRNAREIACTVIILASCCFFVLLTGGRGPILYYAISFFACYSIIKLNSGINAQSFAKRLLLIAAAGALIGSIGFYFLGAVVGRKAGSGYIEYISFYYGGGIPSLSMLLSMGVPTVAILGTRSFYYIFAFLYKIGFISNIPSYSIEWLNVGGHRSNIFTCFARYYLDFGITGLIVLSALSGIILAVLYRKARDSRQPAFILLMSFLTPYIFDMAREEFVFSRLLSVNFLVQIALMVLIIYFMTHSLREDIKRVRQQ